jgi:hypothetical protein
MDEHVTVTSGNSDQSNIHRRIVVAVWSGTVCCAVVACVTGSLILVPWDTYHLSNRTGTHQRRAFVRHRAMPVVGNN